jgi:hypothetical protein
LVKDSNNNPLSGDLDDIELISGPVFGNIKLGCQVPGPPTPSTICASAQYGCSNGTTAWTDSFTYVLQDATDLQHWTNDSTCAGSATTSSSSASKWQAMSVVPGTGGNFTYTKTGMAGWLCASYATGDCQANLGCPNNSAAQGDVFFNQITSGSQATGYNLTGIADCHGAEEVGYGYDPDNACTIPPNGGCSSQPGYCQCGYQAIESHFKSYCAHRSN